MAELCWTIGARCREFPRSEGAYYALLQDVDSQATGIAHMGSGQASCIWRRLAQSAAAHRCSCTGKTACEAEVCRRLPPVTRTCKCHRIVRVTHLLGHQAPRRLGIGLAWGMQVIGGSWCPSTDMQLGSALMGLCFCCSGANASSQDRTWPDRTPSKRCPLRYRFPSFLTLSMT